MKIIVNHRRVRPDLATKQQQQQEQKDSLGGGHRP